MLNAHIAILCYCQEYSYFFWYIFWRIDRVVAVNGKLTTRSIAHARVRPSLS